MSAAKRIEGRPDEGWAWMVALGCFFINFIMAGLARTAGVLYVALIDLYGVSRESATTPFSVRVSVRNMTGPIIGLLGQRFGIRPITTIGALFAAVGSILCFLAPDVFWITIFWGGIHGIGFGLSTVLHIMAIQQYFEKYRASALGLAYSGDCFGTFAFPVLLEFLISSYGVRGTFLILGGIILNVVPAALLLKAPPWLREEKSTSPKDRSKQDSCGQIAVIKADPGMEIMPRLTCETWKTSSHEMPPQQTNTPLKNVHHEEGEKTSTISRMPVNNVKNTLIYPPVEITNTQKQSNMDCCQENGSYFNPSFYETTLQEKINNALNLSHSEKTQPRVEKYREIILSPPLKMVSTSATRCDKKQSLFLTIVQVNINPMFNIISLTLAVYVFLFVAVITVIIDYGIDKGVSNEEGKYLVIGFSAADLVGRISFGRFIDKKVVSMRCYVILTVVTMGFLIGCIPLASNFPLLMTIMALYGLVQGGVAIMFPILIGSYMNRKEENIAMGCVNFYGGIMTFGLAPMIGYFRDNIGSYDGVFYVAGGMTAFMGLLWFLEPIITRWQNRNRFEIQNSTKDDRKITDKITNEKV